ncbi:hypothetical protein M885DRAFT_503097 [Pelagophyceae sp. CCMP2097]|nr:hypothetical protein M885DRAFT_503097 [Pelagophyceae sp. CCMP2097]
MLPAVLIAAVLGLPALALGAYVGHGVSKTTYAASDPWAGRAFLLKYLPVAEATDDCPGAVCKCGGAGGLWTIVQGRVALDVAAEADQISPGFGLHLVNVSARSTSGGVGLEDVEAAFAARVGAMANYDAFVDYNVGLLTPDLARYTDCFDADGVRYCAFSWNAAGANWSSAAVLVPGTHMVVELIGPAPAGAAAPRRTAAVRHMRLGDGQAASALRHLAAAASADYLAAVRVSRATANLTRVDSFYRGAFGVEPVAEMGNRHCFRLETADSTDVCYTEHAEDSKAPLSVSAFEAEMHAAHLSLLSGRPGCGLDKRLDDHFAFDSSLHGSTAAGDAVVAYIAKTPGQLYFCDARGLQYIIDPTGWGIQLDMPFSKQPAGCAVSRPASGNPACALGTC